MHGNFLHVTTFMYSRQLLSKKQHNVLEPSHVLSSLGNNLSYTENMNVVIFTYKIACNLFVVLYCNVVSYHN